MVPQTPPFVQPDSAPTPLPRIRVEEAALREALGDAYETYARHTARLVPGLW